MMPFSDPAISSVPSEVTEMLSGKTRVSGTLTGDAACATDVSAKPAMASRAADEISLHHKGYAMSFLQGHFSGHTGAIASSSSWTRLRRYVHLYTSIFADAIGYLDPIDLGLAGRRPGRPQATDIRSVLLARDMLYTNKYIE
jgi:hypothetical protein